jgi:lipoic acid synthetase
MSLYCEDSRCPLGARCAPAGAGALVVLGPAGTRASVVPPIAKGGPAPVDRGAIDRWVSDVKASGRSRIALIAAARDDLVDGGAAYLGVLIRALRASMPTIAIELHVGDFGGALNAWRDLLRSGPSLAHHAIAAAPRLYAKLLPGGDYVRSLEILRIVKEEFEPVRLRATICLGLGETKDEIVAALADLKSVRAEEVLLVVAEPPLRKAPPAPEVLQRVLAVGGKLGFARLEVVPHPRSCAP